MQLPLKGVKVVEVATWAFVPCAGAVLGDMGAQVIKIEPPEGDPIRALVTGGAGGNGADLNLSWESYNRGKRSITLDLKIEGALEVLHRLVATADVFLTNMLPAARRRLGIDVHQMRPRHPKLIYGIGSGLGSSGPEAAKGGYDAISYWARGGIAASLAPDDAGYPTFMPSGAFGDTTSGNSLAGGIAAALYQRATTGHAAVVDTSLLANSMWSMQRSITGAIAAGVPELPRTGRLALPNPLVNVYRTADGRFVSLCMLQGQRYWPGFCTAIGRPDLVSDERFAGAADRVRNIAACVAELDREFARRSLAEWKPMLASQDGQWDFVQLAGELRGDVQVEANGLLQEVTYGDGRTFPMVSSPLQFDGAVFPARQAPEKGADSDAVLAELGYDDDAVIDLKVAGVVF